MREVMISPQKQKVSLTTDPYKGRSFNGQETGFSPQKPGFDSPSPYQIYKMRGEIMSNDLNPEYRWPALASGNDVDCWLWADSLRAWKLIMRLSDEPGSDDAI